MALQGWRFFGVSATIIIYIGGVLFLSMNNIPGSHPKRTRIERFAEVSRIKPCQGKSKYTQVGLLLSILNLSLNPQV